jgi:L-ascorbate metabolism protein UlaG (beta-lactamase superfamily)
MKIDFFHVGAACFVIKIDGKIKIACDPCLKPEGTFYNFKSFTSTRVKPPIFDNLVFDGINVWLITHSHADHIDEIGVSKIDKESLVITRPEAVKILSNKKLSNLWVMEWNDTRIFSINEYRISIKVIPAFHGNNLMMRMLVGRVNGYLIKISHGDENKVVYVTSDTVYHEKIMRFLAKEKIDILIANLGEVRKNMRGGPLTMSILMLKRMISELSPGEVIPIHYDDFTHYETSKDEINSERIAVHERGRWVTLP